MNCNRLRSVCTVAMGFFLQKLPDTAHRLRPCSSLLLAKLLRVGVLVMLVTVLAGGGADAAAWHPAAAVARDQNHSSNGSGQLLDAPAATLQMLRQLANRQAQLLEFGVPAALLAEVQLHAAALLATSVCRLSSTAALE